jgi:hypothetical protein
MPCGHLLQRIHDAVGVLRIHARLCGAGAPD